MQLNKSLIKLFLGMSIFALSANSFAQGMAEGVVRRIDLDNNKITIRHGDIKALDMPPMTMVFVAKQPALLKSLQPGDEVEFEAFEVNGQYLVGKIKKK
jgi:Cu(I)/Ag(I) efflux system periplasmic protein CusF